MAQAITILSGGTGRELARIGAPFRQPEWSALALYEEPESVLEVHRSFLKAGTETLTINSYSVVPFHLGPERFKKDGARLISLAGCLARQAVEESGRKVKILACLPPALGSYRPDLFDPDQAREIYKVLIENQEAYADVWYGETLSAVREAEILVETLRSYEKRQESKPEKDGSEDKAKPLWLSFTLEDQLSAGKAVLRSGESVSKAVEKAAELGAENILFNCSHPEVMASALKEGRETLKKFGNSAGIGICANAFEEDSDEGGANEALNRIRSDITPERYLEWAKEWIQAGATLIGGCCGIRPAHIRKLSDAFHSKS